MVLRSFFRAGVVCLIFAGLVLVSSCREENEGVPGGAASAPIGPPEYYGAVDHIDCNTISGWVINKTDYNESLKVAVFVDNKLVGKVPADGSRPDLPMGGTGNYGFSLPMPPALKDGKTHVVNAMILDTDFEIPVWDQIKASFLCQP